MRHFNRIPLAPPIQEQLNAKTTTKWRLSKLQRKEVASKLLLAQKSLCAYCECKIDSENYHIEHFVERYRDPDLIYDYNNFLLSCEGDRNPISRPETEEEKIERLNNTTCGHEKSNNRPGIDPPPINYDLLLNPTNNVAHLFDYSDGAVTPSDSCNSIENDQVDYTINRLNLDSTKLNNRRRSTISLILEQIKELNPDDIKLYISALLNEDDDDLEPYFSTIKDNFNFLLLP